MRPTKHSISCVSLRTLSAALATTLLLGACADDSSTARVVGPDSPSLDRNDSQGARGGHGDQPALQAGHQHRRVGADRHAVEG